MAARIRNSDNGGNPKSTEAKSPVRDAESSSPRKARDARVRSAAKSVVDSTSGTTTSIGQSLEDLNTPVATEQPRRTKLKDKGDVPETGEADSVVLPGHATNFVISRFSVGPFIERVLIEVDPETAAQLTQSDISTAREGVVISGVYRDLESIASRSASLAVSALAGTAVALALEMENPHNSATSKSMCAKALLETMEQMRDLLPPEQETSALDELRARREARLNGEPIPENSVGT